MNQEYCEACDDLNEYAYDFVENGVTPTISNRLKADHGFTAKNGDTDCASLNDANDCLIGGAGDLIEDYDVCDIKSWLYDAWDSLHTVLKAMIAAICGLWTKVHCILSGLKTLLEQLTKTDSFAGKTEYAFSSGAGGANYQYAGFDQYIIPTNHYNSGGNLITNHVTYAYDNDDGNGHPTSSTTKVTITGEGTQITYDADGVAVVGCCCVGGYCRGSNAMQILFYTSDETPNTALMNLRGLHYSDYISADETSYRINLSNSMTTAIKVKAGTSLRIWARSTAKFESSDTSVANDYGTHGSTYENGSYVTRADNEAPNTNAKFGIHQIWSTFIPDFSSALDVDKTLFDSCGE